MFVTQNFICFQGNHIGGYDTRVRFERREKEERKKKNKKQHSKKKKKIIPFSQIDSIEKHSVLGISGTGINVHYRPSPSDPNSTTLFHNLKDRDGTFAFLQHIWKYRLGGPLQRMRTPTINVIMKHFDEEDSGDSGGSKKKSGSSFWGRESSSSNSQKQVYNDKMTRKMEQTLQIAEQTAALGEATLVALDSQREQILRIKNTARDIDVDLYKSDRILRGMGSTTGTIANTTKTNNAEKLRQNDEQKRAAVDAQTPSNLENAIEVIFFPNPKSCVPQVFTFTSELIERSDADNMKVFARYQYSAIRRFTLKHRPLRFILK